MKKHQEVLYTTKEVLKYVHSVIEDCALLVCPDPHVEEERSCGDVAEEIRGLKKVWKDSEFVLRTTDDENLFKQRAILLRKYHELTPQESRQLDVLRKRIGKMRTAVDPADEVAMNLIQRAADSIRRAGARRKTETEKQK